MNSFHSLHPTSKLCHSLVTSKVVEIQKVDPISACGCVQAQYSCNFYRALPIRKSNLCKKVTVQKYQNPLHKQSEKVCMCFKTRRVRIRDFKVCTLLKEGACSLFFLS